MGVKDAIGMAAGSLLGVAISNHYYRFPAIPYLLTTGTCFFQGWSIAATATKKGYICAGAQAAGAVAGYLMMGYIGSFIGGAVFKTISCRVIERAEGAGFLSGSRQA